MKFNQLYLVRGCRKTKCTPMSRKQFNFIDALTHFNLSRRVLFLWVLNKQEECAKKAFALFNLPNSSCLVLAFVSHSLLCVPTIFFSSYSFHPNTWCILMLDIWATILLYLISNRIHVSMHAYIYHLSPSFCVTDVG